MTPKKLPPLKVLLIGCGGVGSYLAPPLAKTLSFAAPRSVLILADGDKITVENLDRQLFAEKDVGKFKTTALAKSLKLHDNIKIQEIQAYVSPMTELERVNVVIAAVDNHVARNFALDYADMHNTPVIIAANEDKAADCYIYVPAFGWKDHDRLDPRKMFPEIITDTSDDPNHPEGCTGSTALNVAPQTAEANYIASALALRMFGAWILNKVDSEFVDFLPARFESNFSSISTLTVKQMRESAPK